MVLGTNTERDGNTFLQELVIELNVCKTLCPGPAYSRSHHTSRGEVTGSLEVRRTVARSLNTKLVFEGQ